MLHDEEPAPWDWYQMVRKGWYQVVRKDPIPSAFKRSHLFDMTIECTLSDVKTAHHRLLCCWHPDKKGGYVSASPCMNQKAHCNIGRDNASLDRPGQRLGRVCERHIRAVYGFILLI